MTYCEYLYLSKKTIKNKFIYLNEVQSVAMIQYRTVIRTRSQEVQIAWGQNMGLEYMCSDVDVQCTIMMWR